MKQIKPDYIAGSLALWFVFICSCTQPFTSSGKDEQLKDTVTKPQANRTASSTDISNLFTLSDAEKILGESAHLTDSGSTIKGQVSKYSVNDSVSTIRKDASKYRCAYTANSKDKKTGKTGIVYFLFEHYPQASSAMTVYSFYKRANKNSPGFNELHDLGDEAWFGSDPLFVYVRKGDKIFVMKVNKMTSMTSLDEFNRVVKNITAAL